MKNINLFFVFLIAGSMNPVAVFAQKFSVYNGQTPFTALELLMMKDCDPSGCANRKHFSPVTNPAGVPVVSDPVDTNNQCYEMVFPRCQFSTSDNYCMKCMSYPRGQRQFPLGTFVWQAFSIYVPTDFNHNPDWSVVYQFHDHPDTLDTCDTWQSPSFAIDISGNNWVFVGRYNAQKCDRGGRSTEAFQKSQPIAKGSWTHFVMHVKFDFAGAGRCEVWQKDAQKTAPVKVVDYSGPLGLNDDRMPYDFVTLGYYYGDSDTGSGIVKLYFDRIIFGGTEETLGGMMYPSVSTGSRRNDMHRLSLNATRQCTVVPSVYSGSGDMRIGLSFTAGKASPGRIRISDLGGRVMADLPAGQSVRWNGRDQSGRALAAGIYLVRWEPGTSPSVQIN